MMQDFYKTRKFDKTKNFIHNFCPWAFDFTQIFDLNKNCFWKNSWFNKLPGRPRNLGSEAPLFGLRIKTHQQFFHSTQNFKLLWKENSFYHEILVSWIDQMKILLVKIDRQTQKTCMYLLLNSELWIRYFNSYAWGMNIYVRLRNGSQEPLCIFTF